MNVNTIIGLVITIFIVVGLGGGGLLLFFLKTRPKKETWKAEVYQLGESSRQVMTKGQTQNYHLTLQDMKPYALDTIEKVEKAPGITVFRLQKMNLKVPPVTSEVVEHWGKQGKKVSVLYHKGSCTLLKKGYDLKNGNEIFDPLGHDRIDLIIGQTAIRKDRLRSEKNVLQAISPWIVAGILMVGLVSMTYFMGNSFVTTSQNYKDGTQSIAAAIKAIEQNQGQTATPLVPNGGQKTSPDPPSIE